MKESLLTNKLMKTLLIGLKYFLKEHVEREFVETQYQRK